MISIINDSDFQAGLCVVKFSAQWCGPCKKMEPIISQLESEFDMIKFMSVDIDQAPLLAQKFKIRTIPTILFLRDGKEISRTIGLSAIEPMRKLFGEITKSLDAVI